MWTRRGREGRRGPISPLVTDSSVQTTSPQGRSQEAGPLTQAEEKGGGSEQQRRSTSAGHIGQTEQDFITDNYVMVIKKNRRAAVLNGAFTEEETCVKIFG